MLALKMELSSEFHDHLDKYSLCYIHGQIAYFTTQMANNQDGINWDAKPHTCAGAPFTPRQVGPFANSEIPKWGILSLHFHTGLQYIYPQTEDDKMFSVKDINNGSVPWIQGNDLCIYAGVTPKDFVDFLLANEVKNTTPKIIYGEEDFACNRKKEK